MTEELESPESIFASLNVPKILIAILEKLGEVTVPSNSFLNAGTEDKELQVDYNSDNQTFTFKLKESNGQSDDNVELPTDTE